MSKEFKISFICFIILTTSILIFGKIVKADEVSALTTLKGSEHVNETLTDSYLENIKIAKQRVEEFNSNNKLNKEDIIKQEESRKKLFEEQLKDLEENRKIGEEKVKTALAPKEEISTDTVTKEINEDDYLKFRATAYDLSHTSCGKVKGDWGYGITAGGHDLRGLTREQAMLIAVDPEIIPLGSKVEVIVLTEGFEHYSGIYLAGDTGGLVKGDKVDIFNGDYDMYYEHESTVNFGIRDALVRIID